MQLILLLMLFTLFTLSAPFAKAGDRDSRGKRIPVIKDPEPPRTRASENKDLDVEINRLQLHLSKSKGIIESLEAGNTKSDLLTKYQNIETDLEGFIKDVEALKLTSGLTWNDKWTALILKLNALKKKERDLHKELKVHAPPEPTSDA